MVDRVCEKCGKQFSVIPSRIKYGRGKHCSPACQYAAIRARPRDVIEFKCIGCGSLFYRYPSWTSRSKGAGKYCTRECRDKYWIGSKNPHWQNADRVYRRGPYWFATKRRVIARDKCCQTCGANGLLHVHHIIPFRMFDIAAEADTDSNLIALCPPCHRKEDARHKWVKINNGGGALCFGAGSIGWQLAREKGMI